MPAMANKQKALSITELTRIVRTTLEGKLGRVWVEGEISNLRKQSSGHQYFSLKDSGAQLRCVLFRGNDRGEFELKDGMKVLAFGDVSVYEAQGQYQLIVRTVQPKGLGELQARFEALKKRLDAEGLFRKERKKRLPRFPGVVALVTSPSGAAIRDMLNILSRRAPWVRILVLPVRVQGEGAATEIADAIRWLSTQNEPGLPPIDSIIVGRGGGSIEDLWNFNEEVVARAIADCPLPIVSAVGHEIDFTIADFVADLRAPTPSAAAELVVPDRAELAESFGRGKARMEHAVRTRLEHWTKVVELLARSGAFREPERVFLERSQRLDELEQRLADALRAQGRVRRDRLETARRLLEASRPDRILVQRRERLDALAERMDAIPPRVIDHGRRQLTSLASILRTLGPGSVMSRGYSITTDADGQIVNSAAGLKPGDTLKTRFQDGVVSSSVTGTESEAAS